MFFCFENDNNNKKNNDNNNNNNNNNNKNKEKPYRASYVMRTVKIFEKNS